MKRQGYPTITVSTSMISTTVFFLFVIRTLRYSGYLTNTSCVCQVAGISKKSNDKHKSFFPKKKNWHVTIRDFEKQKI